MNPSVGTTFTTASGFSIPYSTLTAPDFGAPPKGRPFSLGGVSENQRSDLGAGSSFSTWGGGGTREAHDFAQPVGADNRFFSFSNSCPLTHPPHRLPSPPPRPPSPVSMNIFSSISVPPSLSLNEEQKRLLDSTRNHVSRFNSITCGYALSVHLSAPISNDSSLAALAAARILEQNQNEANEDAQRLDLAKKSETQNTASCFGFSATDRRDKKRKSKRKQLAEVGFLKALKHYPHLTQSLITERLFQLTQSKDEYTIWVVVRQGLCQNLPVELAVIVTEYMVDNMRLHLEATDTANGQVSSRSACFPSIWECPSPVVLNGVTCWDITKNTEMILTQKHPGYVLGQYYTHGAWVKWNPTILSWRTFLRNDDDHIILLEHKRLGFYSNRDGLFRPCGFNVVADEEWHHVVVVAAGVSEDSSSGKSSFFYDGVFVGNADRVGCGTRLKKFALDTQGPGHVSSIFLWERALPPSEIMALYNQGRILHPLQKPPVNDSL